MGVLDMFWTCRSPSESQIPVTVKANEYGPYIVPHTEMSKTPIAPTGYQSAQYQSTVHELCLEATTEFGVQTQLCEVPVKSLIEVIRTVTA